MLNDYPLPVKIRLRTDSPGCIRPGEDDLSLSHSQNSNPFRVLYINAPVPEIVTVVIGAVRIEGAAPGGVRIAEGASEPEVGPGQVEVWCIIGPHGSGNRGWGSKLGWGVSVGGPAGVGVKVKVGVASGVGVSVVAGVAGSAVAVGVSAAVGVSVAVRVSAADSTSVAVSVRVADGWMVGVSVATGVGEAVSVAVSVAVAVLVAVAVDVGVLVSVGGTVSVAVAVAVGAIRATRPGRRASRLSVPPMTRSNTTVMAISLTTWEKRLRCFKVGRPSGLAAPDNPFF